MKRIRKGIVKAIIVAIISVLLECMVFNFAFFANKFFYKLESQKYSLTQLVTMNWQKDGGELISQPDPMILFEGLNERIRTITIEIDSSDTIPYTDVFYTNEEHPVLTGELLHHEKRELKDRLVVKLNKDVKDLRIDLGDSEGVVLKDITIAFNQFIFDFSFSRIVAMNLIYWVGVLLFAMQRPPKYDI